MSDRPRPVALTLAAFLGLAAFAFAALCTVLVVADLMENDHDVSAGAVAYHFGKAVFILLLGLSAGLVSLGAVAFAAAHRSRAEVRPVLLGAAIAAALAQLVLVAPFARSVWYYVLDPVGRLHPLPFVVILLAGGQLVVLLAGALARRRGDGGADSGAGTPPAAAP